MSWPLAAAAERATQAVCGTTMVSSKGGLECGGDIGRGRGRGWHCELIVVVADSNARLERCDQVWVRVHHIETANHSLPTRVFLQQIFEHPMHDFRVRKRFANAGELLIRNGKVFEVLLTRTPKIRGAVS